MKIKFTAMRWVLVGLLFFPFTLYSQELDTSVDFSGQFFFSYERIFEDEGINNEFTIQRGYITFRKRLTQMAQIRFTQDVSIDQEGDGKGDIELRLKYALLKLNFDDYGFLASPYAEIGVVHRPWIDFEQKINDYRSQESMFLDQNGLVRSADYGVTFASLIGGEIDESFQQEIQSSYPGRYGSLSVGIYNGGGYNSLEENNNKLLEGRLTIRPFPDHIPGFQTSIFGSYGKGNIPQSPDFEMISTAISYESFQFTTLLQGFTGTGDASGNFVTNNFQPIDLKGWSHFIEIRPIKSIPIKLINRFDEIVNTDTNLWTSRQAVGGVAYRFPNSSKIILNLRRNWMKINGKVEDINRLEIITEIRF
ncbi:MAG: hypothetical protein GVY20_00110 [Bacteroidetes bacterium]|jgi:hypothetical protein|nr:hypothetical protein [Bacteroidota bacterium]